MEYEIIINNHLYDISSVREYAMRYKAITDESILKLKEVYSEAINIF